LKNNDGEMKIIMSKTAEKGFN